MSRTSASGTGVGRNARQEKRVATASATFMQCPPRDARLCASKRRVEKDQSADRTRGCNSDSESWTEKTESFEWIKPHCSYQNLLHEKLIHVDPRRCAASRHGPRESVGASINDTRLTNAIAPGLLRGDAPCRCHP